MITLNGSVLSPAPTLPATPQRSYHRARHAAKTTMIEGNSTYAN